MSVPEAFVRCSYVLIIDTNKYSGDFEREMSAYVSGCPNEYHGRRQAEEFVEDMAEGFLISQDEDKPDDFRWSANPFKFSTQLTDEAHEVLCSIWPTPGRLNNGTGQHFDDTPNNRKHFKRVWEAYESVAIFLYEQPTAQMMDVVLARAKNYIKAMSKKKVDHENYNNFELRGIRLLKNEIVQTMTEVPLAELK